MSADCFTWHRDQSDVYQGCGTMTINGAPSAFHKDQPYGFMMKGEAGDVLTLSATPTSGDVATQWGRISTTSTSFSSFNIQSGTFVYNSVGTGALVLGDQMATGITLLLYVWSRCHIVAPIVMAYILTATKTPATELSLFGSGTFTISADAFSGGFNSIIAGTSMVQIHANEINLAYGNYTVSSIPVEGDSFDINTSFPAPDKTSGINVSNVTMTCKSSSRTRLQSESISLTSSNIDLQESATITIDCDTMMVNQSSFTLSPDSPRLTINGRGTGDLPFDPKRCPPAMVNFIVKSGSTNTGSFRIRAPNRFYANDYFILMLQNGLLAVNGNPSGASDGWRITFSYEDSYMVLRLTRN
ncbi:hypothetical protein GCM10011491_28570 [Brucella endophytica]|uniref:Uncharacterized protein n=1 Tax=Brucella endophytica TaxID=1963359 RepID=A0A916SGB8_9HYPH|nr:hypothetical protein [Brucella endophytica]GGA98602.1 hypothetical protein GCM10011491_28570 [Brucella endophytica]